MTDNPEGFESFCKNVRNISMVCPNTFLISRDGVLSGTLDQRLLDTARKYRIKVVPLIVNSGFTSVHATPRYVPRDRTLMSLSARYFTRVR